MVVDPSGSIVPSSLIVFLVLGETLFGRSSLHNLPKKSYMPAQGKLHAGLLEALCRIMFHSGVAGCRVKVVAGPV